MKKILIYLSLFITTIVLSQELPKFKIMTENYPPFNMQVKDKTSGISVDVFEEILKRVNSKQNKSDIELISWSRAYNIVQKKKNTILFSMTRTNEREELFKWVGPIAHTVSGLIAKKEKSIKINSLADLKKYKVGAVLNDIGEQILLNENVSKENIDTTSGSNALIKSIRKLDANRIDMFSYSVEVAFWEMKSNNVDISKYENVFDIKKLGLYLAFEKNTPDWIIKMFQDSLDEIKQDGTYENILKRYK